MKACQPMPILPLPGMKKAGSVLSASGQFLPPYYGRKNRGPECFAHPGPEFALFNLAHTCHYTEYSRSKVGWE